MFELNHRDRLRLYPLCKLFYGNKQMRVAPRHSFDRSDHIEPTDHEWPHDGNHLECLGWQVGLSGVVLTPFIGAHNLLSVGHHSRPIEAQLEHVSDQGSRCSMMSVDPTVDIAQQMLPLLGGDAALQDLSVPSLVEFALHKNKGLGATCEPSGLCLVHQQRILEEVVEVGHPLVDQRVRLYR